MKYEVVLFDADDTLFDYKRSEKDAFKNVMLEFDINYEENHHLKIYQGINSALWKEFEQGLITQEKLKTERFRRLSDTLRLGLDEIELASSYIKHLANSSYLFEESLELVESLHKQYKLAIVTNGLKDVQSKRIKESIIAKYFTQITVSEEILLSKPDPRIFEHTLASLNHTDKSKVLVVGDSLTSDIRGGINFGVDTCWYNPHRIINKTNIRPTYEINTLSELGKILAVT